MRVKGEGEGGVGGWVRVRVRGGGEGSTRLCGACLDKVLGGVVGRGEVVQGQVLLCLVHPGVLDQLLHA